MRKLAIFCALICAAYIAFPQNADEQNVIKAIQAKIDAYYNRDLAGWKASWQHDAKISNTVTNRNFYNTIKGWDSMQAMMERDIKQNPNPDRSYQVKLDNFSIQSNGNMAIADYDMIFTPTVDQSSVFPYMGAERYHAYEMLVKEGDAWKTNTRVLTFPDSYKSSSDHEAETNINTAGYNLINAKKIKEAIDVFRLNVKLFPDSWNTYDSLGEALALAGNKKEAIENYEKSVLLNPKSNSGKEAIAKLKQK